MLRNTFALMLVLILTACGGGGGGGGDSQAIDGGNGNQTPGQSQGEGGGEGGGEGNGDGDGDGDGGGDGNQTSGYTIGGTVEGLAETITLTNNGSESLEISEDGRFVFSTRLEMGSTYRVEIAQTPKNLKCNIEQGEGTVSDVNVTGIRVTCLGKDGFNIQSYGVVSQSPSVIVASLRVADRATGKPVPSLNVNDFVVEENGAPINELEAFTDAEKVADANLVIRTTLILDISQSLSADDIRNMKQAAKFLVDNKLPQQEISIYTFDDRVFEIQSFTSDQLRLNFAISNIEENEINRGNSTNLYGAVFEAMEKVKTSFDLNSARYGYAILFSDGDDTSASVSKEIAESSVGDKDLYAVTLGSQVDEKTVIDLTRSSERDSQRVFPIDNIDSLGAEFQKIQEQALLQTQGLYRVYYATPKRSGEHEVKISLSENTGCDNFDITCSSSVSGYFDADGFSNVTAELIISVDGRKENDFGFIAVEPGEVEMSARLRWSNIQPDFEFNSGSDVEISEITVVDGKRSEVKATIPEEYREITVYVNDRESGLSAYIQLKRDTDGDGDPNYSDEDDDGDGFLDNDDDFPLDPTESVDTDGDGVGNNKDMDDDNDGISDDNDESPLERDNPIAVKDSYDVESRTMDLRVLANDSFGRFGAAIQNAFVITTQPTLGSAGINNNNTPNDFTDDYIQYIVDKIGEDTLTYQLTDRSGETSTTTVLLNINQKFTQTGFSAGDKSKTLNIEWQLFAPGSLDHITISSNPDGRSGFTVITGAEKLSNTATSFEVTIPAIHLTDWINGQYMLEAKDSSGNVLASETVNLTQALSALAIGYLKASHPDVSDFFGLSVALSADGNTLAVGAYGEDSNATGVGGYQTNKSANSSGAVYIFSRNSATNGSWGQQAYIKASNTDANDYFGYFVALSADGNTLAVGAYDEDSNATGVGGNQINNSVGSSGAVYVFSQNSALNGVANGGWAQQAYIKASNTDSDDRFGSSVALSADGNTLAVGAYGEDSNATGVGGNQTNNSAGSSGAVYVFSRNSAVNGVANDGWAQQAYIKASNTDADDRFGNSVALSADGNTLAVGAVNESSNATGIGGNETDNSSGLSGAVYVFSRNVEANDTDNGGWSQQAYIKASNTSALSRFGSSVALSADGNTLAVGAYGEDSNATGVDGNQTRTFTDSGAVYAFSRNVVTNGVGNGGWAQEAYIKASNTGFYDRFGISVALSAGGNMLAVAAFGEDSNATGVGGNQTNDSARYSGAVYVFSRNSAVNGAANGGWVQQAYIKASNTDTNDLFGSSVALSADGTTLAIGAPHEDSDTTGINGDQTNNSFESSGAVYLY